MRIVPLEKKFEEHVRKIMLLAHMNRTISARPILRAVHALIAVAVDSRTPPSATRAPSPTNSPGVTSVMVASFPAFETTVTLALPFRREKIESAGYPCTRKSLLRAGCAQGAVPARHWARNAAALNVGFEKLGPSECCFLLQSWHLLLVSIESCPQGVVSLDSM